MDDHRYTNPNRDSSRSSTSTLTGALHPVTIVRSVSVARRVDAYVVDNSSLEKSRERARVASNASAVSALSATSGAPSPAAPAFLGSSTATTPASSTTTSVPTPIDSAKYPPSPSLSAYFGGGGSSEESGSSSSMSHEQPTMTDTPTTDGGLASPLTYYLDGAQTPSPTPDKMVFSGGVQTMPPKRLPVRPEYDDDLDEEEEFMGYPDEDSAEAKAAIARAQAASTTPPAARPTIVISSETVSPSISGNATELSTTTSTPLSPFQRYRGWLSAVVAPLEEFIDEAVDPREHYLDLREIAEGESGSVFAAMLNSSTAHKLRLPPLVKARDADEILHGRTVLVAIKSVAIVPSGSPKLVDLQRELGLMRGLGLGHENVLGMDGVYVDLVEDSLWVRMELMERSLADIIGLAGDGLQLQERTIARFASDVLCALEYLQKHHIAHRDVRSDNLLLNKHGVLKLADFSNAIQVTRESSMRDDVVGVPFWQAPEVRRPPYDALRVDVWSLGATVWEMAQQDPPFADTQQLAERWPPLRQPDLFSPAFHDFLRKCSEPAAVRPSPGEIPFITHKACGRQVVVLLLAQCMAIEKHLQEGNGAPSP
ncbi:hypothetical protein M413DRAFT_71058 [Hebeloma cylindrosporum]|uniref:Protein kinase domain-containing protein n=1 Tax=Hebeloma cylindrosporum TaxID=76867 RepID=A0A0C3CBW0_HEBCY|nr:hypothetical protein M413DRAFT_71058 [Hebeloma cylindrosporum h7]